MIELWPQHFSFLRHFARRFWNHTWNKENKDVRKVRLNGLEVINKCGVAFSARHFESGDGRGDEVGVEPTEHSVCAPRSEVGHPGGFHWSRSQRTLGSSKGLRSRLTPGSSAKEEKMREISTIRKPRPSFLETNSSNKYLFSRLFPRIFFIRTIFPNIFFLFNILTNVLKKPVERN